MRLLSHNEGAVHGHQHKGRRACDAVAAGIAAAHLKPEEFLFPSRVSDSPHLSTRQYSRIVGAWVGSIGLDPAAYATHTMRRTKATLIYRRTRNLRAVQLLLGHTKLDWRARSDTSGSRWTTRWRLRSKLRCRRTPPDRGRQLRRSWSDPDQPSRHTDTRHAHPLTTMVVEQAWERLERCFAGDVHVLRH